MEGSGRRGEAYVSAEVRQRRRDRALHRRRQERRRRYKRAAGCLILLLFFVCFALPLAGRIKRARRKPSEKPEITEDFLTPNPYSRPGEALQQVDHIFVHYTANPGTTAAQNRSYFENLKDTHETSASAHFIIGYEGEIIQCIPLDEIGYAVSGRNENSVSIECCYLSEDGKFTDETLESLKRLVNWLTYEYRRGPEDVLRHYDANGKLCPLYFAENPEAWEAFLAELEE